MNASGEEVPAIATDPSPAVARVRGVPIAELPHDLYIPPDALEVVLEAFEGPLDLLLYLIRRHNLDILDIPIARVTEQYIQYIDLMQVLRIELAAEYLVMAAILAEAKSRMLLPRPVAVGEPEPDPRAELARRLLEYERYKRAAEQLDELPCLGRDVHEVVVAFPDRRAQRPLPVVTLAQLVEALQEVLQRAPLDAHLRVTGEPLSVRERMLAVLERLRVEGFVEFSHLFTPEEGRRGIVVTLLALLELRRQALVDLVQTEQAGPIHVRSAA